MRCPRCEQENAYGSNFCRACGTRLAARCRACGAELPAESRFCPRCGSAVAEAPAGEARFASPAAYTPKHLAEKILRSRAALEGERKLVTVLFADLQSSMEVLADRDPEEARKILDAVLERMMEAVHRYEGTVNQVMGDGIMALFGAPIAREDHAVRACYAALHMQDAVKRYAEALRRGEGLDVQIRVGLNSGEVVVRSIGSDLRMDYSAVGQTTHLAARMEQMARPGAILVSAATQRLVEAHVDLKALGPVAVKGLREPVAIFEVAGARPARAWWQARARRPLARFVGRDAELEALGRILDRVRAGRGEVVALVGEPGVGKSRLVWEFLHSGRTEGWLVLESGCPSYGLATPYLAISELVKAWAGIEPGADAGAIRDKVAAKVLGLERALAPDLPAVLALLDVPGEDPEWQSLDPPQRRQRIHRAIRHLLLRQSQVQPLCVVVEDLHWADPETRAVLDTVVEGLGAARILLLVNYRPDFQHEWGSRTCYNQLRLDPLTAESAEELLRALLGADARLRPLAQLLIARTDGNPFFLEETVRTLAETGTLDGEPGAYRLARPVHALQVPATVETVLAARIDRLPAEDKRVMQTAAVIGQHVPYALLQDIADVPEDDLRRRLASLQAAEFLYEARLFPEPEYTFKHSLTHEVAYRSLLHDVRRALHARIVDAIERRYPDRLAEQVDRLAHHAVQGEVWRKAVPACRQAGSRAFARSAPRAAVAWFEQALAALERLPETPETLADAIDLRLDLRSSLIPLGEFRRVIDELHAAERLARDLGEQPRLGAVTAFLSNYFTITGDLQRGVEYGRRALAIADALGEFSLRVLANGALAMAHVRLGGYRRAIEFARANVAALGGELLGERFGMTPLASVYSRTVLVWALAEVGEFVEAAAVGAEAIRIAEAARHPYSLCFACQGLGTLRLRQGDLREALAALERALAVCRAADIPLLFPAIVSPLASAYAAAGRAGEALALLEEGVQRALAFRDPFGRWLRTGGLAEALLAAGRIDEAVPLARQAIEITRYVKARGAEAWALRLLAEATARRDPPDADESSTCYARACAIADELGMRPLAAHCHFGLGRLYRRAGEREQARTHLASAAASYRQLDMRSWLERAETDLAEAG